jgi:tRNA pseudouridine38-40 synthase
VSTQRRGRAEARPSERFFKLAIAYDGTAYGGWQLQPNKVTVQELLERALAKMAGKRVVVHGSGRTDAGVHAREQIASCAFDMKLEPAVLVLALNANLPEDVRVLRVQETDARFHARFSAKAKEYRYQIDTGKAADPFLRRYAWHHPRPLDLPAMRRAAKLLVGRHDFSALSAKSERHPVRTIRRLTITKRGNLLTITIVADGFLYKMARTIVGALVKVGEGKLSVEELRGLRKRIPLVETAPPHGLILWKVFY